MSQSVRSANAHIVDYVAYYCALRRPGFAVLIDGPWGCGKTHLARAIEVVFRDRKIKYVSLHRFDTLEAAKAALLHARVGRGFSLLAWLAWLPWLLWTSVSLFLMSQGVLKSGGDLGKAVFSTWSKGLKHSIEMRRARKAGAALIIDDVERSALSDTELLGLVNELVDDMGGNVILVSDRSRLLSDRPDLKQRLEKVVGQTLVIKSDAISAASHFLDEVLASVSDMPWRAQGKDAYLDCACLVFDRSGFGNLRLLRTAIMAFSRVVMCLPKRIVEHQGAMLLFMKGYLSRHMEWNRGEVAKEDEMHLWDLGYVAFLAAPGREARAVSKLREKYEVIGCNAVALEANDWRELIAYGRIDTERVACALDLHTKNRRDVPAWRRLILDTGKSDDEAAVDIRECVDALKQHRLPSAGVIISVGVYLTLLQKHGVLLDGEDYLATAKGAINALVAADDFMADVMNGVGCDIRGRPEVHAMIGGQVEGIDELRGHFEAQWRLRLKAHASQYAVEWMERIPQDIMQACEDLSGNSKFGGVMLTVPVLSKCDPCSFMEMLDKLADYGVRKVADAIDRRMKVICDKNAADEERKWLYGLQPLLQEEIGKKAGRYSVSGWRYFSEVLGAILTDNRIGRLA